MLTSQSKCSCHHSPLSLIRFRSHRLVHHRHLKQAVRDAIGPIATPDFIVYSDLPKTRSGKIMRRILRKISHGEEDSIGDTTTLADPTVVGRLIAKFKEAYHAK